QKTPSRSRAANNYIIGIRHESPYPCGLMSRAALLLLRPQESGHRPSWRRHHHHRNLAMAAQRAGDRHILLAGAHVLKRYEASRTHVVSPTKGLLGNPSPVGCDTGRRKVPGAIRHQPAEAVE